MLTCRVPRSYHLPQKMKSRVRERTPGPTDVGTRAVLGPSWPYFGGLLGVDQSLDFVMQASTAAQQLLLQQELRVLSRADDARCQEDD